MGEEREHRHHLAEEKVGIYIHIPFCKSKCIYCDFASFSGQERYYGIYKECLLKEIAQRKDQERTYGCDTVYIGGGTPSIFPEGFLEEILGCIRGCYILDDDAEITVEANPESISQQKLRHYARIGINRISIGFQSLNDSILEKIGRIHTSAQALDSFEYAREAGFENISIDMIAGLPGHTTASFTEDLEGALALRPEHLSVYLLEIDKETPLVRYLRQNEMKIPDEDAMVQLYGKATHILHMNGYAHYEISNYALPQKFSRHNMKYWSDMPYAGFGSSAHSYVQGERWSNEKDFRTYIDMIMNGKDPVIQVEKYEPRKRIVEALFMGLRLLEGVDIGKIKRKYGADVKNEYALEIKNLEQDGLIEMNGNTLRLTERGIIFSNEVFLKFI